MEIDIEDCIERISNNGNIEDMHRLSEILEDTLEVLERENPQISKKYQRNIRGKSAYPPEPVPQSASVLL